jgi:hypothetical protein
LHGGTEHLQPSRLPKSAELRLISRTQWLGFVNVFQQSADSVLAAASKWTFGIRRNEPHGLAEDEALGHCGAGCCELQGNGCAESAA